VVGAQPTNGRHRLALNGASEAEPLARRSRTARAPLAQTGASEQGKGAVAKRASEEERSRGRSSRVVDDGSDSNDLRPCRGCQTPTRRVDDSNEPWCGLHEEAF
jgi:hypothetical protein